MVRGYSPYAHHFNRVVWDDSFLCISVDSDHEYRFCVSFGDIAQFALDFAEQEISVREAGDSPCDTVRHLLTDQIFPRILAQQGHLVIHAAGVAASDGAVLLVGRSGSGKSTLGASLHNSGYALLGDDAIVISNESGRIAGHAVYRSLRLYPDSVANLLDRSTRRLRVSAYTTKQNVLDPEEDARSSPSPVRAAVLLEPSVRDEISMKSIAPSRACIAFIEHSFWLDPTDLRSTKERMTRASALASQVPSFRLRYPHAYSRLPDVHKLIAKTLG